MRTVALIAFLSWPGSALSQETIVHDFRGGRFDARVLRYEGTNARQFIKPMAEGLCWQFSRGNVPAKPVGVAWNFPVRGDFVATAHYEVTADDPAERQRQARLVTIGTALLGLASPGVSLGPFPQAAASLSVLSMGTPALDVRNSPVIEMYLMLDTPARDGVAFSRRLNGPFVYKHLTNDEAGARRAREHKVLSTSQRSDRGRLRVARQGPVFVFSAAEGDQGEFHEFHRTDIGTMNVRLFRFAGLPAAKNADFNVRLLSFELQGDVSRRRYLWFLAFVAGIVSIVLLIALWWRSRGTAAPERAIGGNPGS